MACASFSRREQSRFCAVAQAAKLCGDIGKSQIDMALDIFGEDPFGRDFADNTRDFWPEVAGIGFASSLAGEAEGLARITGRDDMNAAAPRLAVKGSEIVPDRRVTQGLVAHPRHESGRCVSFPLDVTDSAVSGLGDVEAEIEAGVTGAERQAAKLVIGTWSHKFHLLTSLDRRSGTGSLASIRLAFGIGGT